VGIDGGLSDEPRRCALLGGNTRLDQDGAA
jgi:hypothetical protein